MFIRYLKTMAMAEASVRVINEHKEHWKAEIRVFSRGGGKRFRGVLCKQGRVSS